MSDKKVTIYGLSSLLEHKSHESREQRIGNTTTKLMKAK